MQRGLVIDQMYSCRVEFFQATAQLGQPAVEVRQIVSKKFAEGGDALRIGVFGIEEYLETKSICGYFPAA